MDVDIQRELKLNNLQSMILMRQHQLQVIESLLQSISSTKIDSEEDILQVVAEVHNTMKKVQRTVQELKDPCYELNLKSLYQLFKNITLVMVSAVRLLAEGCQNGIQCNLLKFTTSKNCLQGETLATADKNIDEGKQNRIKQIENKKKQYYNEVREQIQFENLYDNIQSQKQSIQRVASSNVVYKLNEVRLQWLQMINQADSILEQIYTKNNENAKESFRQKLHRPQYITKIMKEELSVNIKKYFKNSVQNIIRKLYSEFYQNQRKKLKEKQKLNTIEVEQQTDIQGLCKVKQLMKQKIKHEKTVKQLQKVQNEKSQIAEQYSIANKNNELYIMRIQQLERKLINLVPFHSLEKKLLEPRSSFSKYSRKNSINSVVNNDEQTNQNRKGEIQLHFSNKFLKQKQKQAQKNKNTQNIQIIKKKPKLQRIYSKSRMHTQNKQLQQFNDLVKKQKIESNAQQSEKNSSNNFAKKINQNVLKQTIFKILQLTEDLQTINIDKKQNNKNYSEQSTNKLIKNEKVSAKSQTVCEKILSNPKILESLIQSMMNVAIQKQDLKQLSDNGKSTSIPIHKKNNSKIQSQLKTVRQSLIIHSIKQNQRKQHIKKSSIALSGSNSHLKNLIQKSQSKPYIQKINQTDQKNNNLPNSQQNQNFPLFAQFIDGNISIMCKDSNFSKKKIANENQLTELLQQKIVPNSYQKSVQMIFQNNRIVASNKMYNNQYQGKLKFCENEKSPNLMIKQKNQNCEFIERFDKLNLEETKQKQSKKRKEYYINMSKISKIKRDSKSNLTETSRKKYEDMGNKTFLTKPCEIRQMLQIKRLKTVESKPMNSIQQQKQFIKDIIEICKANECSKPKLEHMLSNCIKKHLQRVNGTDKIKLALRY